MSLTVSFEVFAPKSIPASFQLARAVDELALYNPNFISVTCGTGGGANTLTEDTIRALHRQIETPVVAHMTCGAQSKSDLKKQLRDYASQGIAGIVALRGDADPDGAQADYFETVPDFIQAAQTTNDLPCYVAAYPETHPLAPSAQTCLDALKAKQDAGATAAITQFFFEADTFLRFRDRCVAAGITLPLIPGILPVTNWAAAQRMAQQCGTAISADLAEGFARAAREDRAALMATAHSVELCDHLQRHGVDHLHFYTMNRAQPSAQICTALGLSTKPALRQVA